MMFKEKEDYDGRYGCFNPAYVRRVWRERRRIAGLPVTRPLTNYKGWTNEQKAQVAELFQKGLTQGQIGRTIGRTPNSVAGLISRNPQWRAARNATGKDTHG